jgi:MFS family permease
MSADAKIRSIGPLTLPVYIPNLLFSTGQGAIVPILALDARQLGASVALTGIVVAASGLGTVAFDIPAGWVVARLGEEWAGYFAAALVALGVIGALFSHTGLWLALSIFIISCGSAVWVLVRLTHVSRVVIPQIRGRALSMLGGTARLGAAIGPLVLVGLAPSIIVRTAFLLYFAAVILGFILLCIVRERVHQTSPARTQSPSHVFKVLRDNAKEFASAGTSAFMICLLRASRQLLLPLWALHLGFGAAHVSLIFGTSAVVELALFYPAGIISDRFGRWSVAYPCLLLLAAGHILLPTTHTFNQMIGVAILLGVGNGMGSGIVMTLGADRAPEIGRAEFLAVWRLVSDAGTAVGPLLCAAIIAFASLGSASVIIGAVGLATTGTVFVARKNKVNREPLH